MGMASERSAGFGGRPRAEDVVYTSFPSTVPVIFGALFGVDVPDGSGFGASTECTPRVHPCMNEKAVHILDFTRKM